jgi:hypothetical protein
MLKCVYVLYTDAHFEQLLKICLARTLVQIISSAIIRIVIVNTDFDVPPVN